MSEPLPSTIAATQSALTAALPRPDFEGSLTITAYDCAGSICVAAGSATLWTHIDLGYATFRLLSQRRSTVGAYWTAFGASTVCTASCGTFRVNTSTTLSDVIKTFSRNIAGVTSRLVTSFTGSWKGSPCFCDPGQTPIFICSQADKACKFQS